MGPGGELRVRVRAAPADGEANVAVRRILAEILDIPPSAVTLEAGASARTKRLRVTGWTAGELAARWPGLEASNLL